MTSVSVPMPGSYTVARAERKGARGAVAVKVARFQARNIARSRWLAAYTTFFLLATEGLLRFSGDRASTVLSLTNIVLYVVPLATLIVGTVYLYNSREFVELLLAQPTNRRSLFVGLYGGLAVPLALSVAVGITVPFLFHGVPSAAEFALIGMLLTIAVTLTLSFAGIAMVVALRTDDRLRGLSAAIGVWLLGAIVYDGALLTLVASFGDYPIERPLLALTVLNPIDLARIAMLLQLDVSALMGYTGAVVQQFLGGAVGLISALSALTAWVVLPVLLGMRMFSRKDF